MKRFLLTLICGVALSGVAVNQTYGAPQQQQSSGTSGPSGTVKAPSYPITGQGNQYYYPTYPEYAEPGYAVQTGVETYLVPSQPQNKQEPGLFSSLGPLAQYALSYGARAGSYILSSLIPALVGVAFTTLICTFTPLCTIAFPGLAGLFGLLGLGKSQIKEQVKEMARAYMTPERVNTMTTLVKRAIDRYAALQTQQHKDQLGTQKEDVEPSSDQ